MLINEMTTHCNKDNDYFDCNSYEPLICCYYKKRRRPKRSLPIEEVLQYNNTFIVSGNCQSEKVKLINNNHNKIPLIDKLNVNNNTSYDKESGNNTSGTSSANCCLLCRNELIKETTYDNQQHYDYDHDDNINLMCRKCINDQQQREIHNHEQILPTDPNHNSCNTTKNNFRHTSGYEETSPIRMATANDTNNKKNQFNQRKNLDEKEESCRKYVKMCKLIHMVKNIRKSLLLVLLLLVSCNFSSNLVNAQSGSNRLSNEIELRSANTNPSSNYNISRTDQSGGEKFIYFCIAHFLKPIS